MAKGYENILFSEKIEYFGHTSGTTGKQKLIPTTKSSRLIGSKYMAILLNRFAYDNLKDVWNCESMYDTPITMEMRTISTTRKSLTVLWLS